MIGIALEGGGAKGAYEIGAYVALKKHLKNIKMIAGTSIGSINAALLVQGDIKKAMDLWMSVDSSIFGFDTELNKELKNSFNLKNMKAGLEEIKAVIKNKGIDTKKLRDLIDEAIDEDRVRNSKIKLGLVTVRLNDLKPLEVTIDDIPYGKLKDYLMASCYLPIFKSEKIIDNKYYIDGGFYNNLPVSLLEKNGCDKIYAIRLNSLGIVKKYTGDVVVIKPNKSTGPGIFFSKNDVTNNIRMGYLDALKSLNFVLGKTYYFKKKKFYFVNVKKVSSKTLDVIKLKFKSDDYKEILFLALEEVLFYNKFDVLKLYEINKTLKLIKKGKLKCRSSVINDFIYSVDCKIG